MTRGRNAILPCVAVASYVFAVLFWLHNDRRAPLRVFDDSSIHNTSPKGLSLAHAYLSKRAERSAARSRVAALTRAIAPDGVESDAVVFRVSPSHLPAIAPPPRAGANEPTNEVPVRTRASSLLSWREEEWIRGGGRLVIALDGPYGPVGVEEALVPGEPLKALPIWPAVHRLELEQARVLVDMAPGHPHSLFLIGARQVASLRRIGNGELILMSCPEVLQNERLGQGDHLALLETLAGSDRPVYFDEAVHGSMSDAGIVETMVRLGLGPFLLTIALTAAAAFWRARTRVGPPEEPWRESRSEAVDLVDSLARLYGRALGRRDAIALYHECLARAVALRTGLRGERLAERVKELTGDDPPPAAEGRRDMGAAEFKRWIRTINDAFARVEHVESL